MSNLPDPPGTGHNSNRDMDASYITPSQGRHLVGYHHLNSTSGALWSSGSLNFLKGAVASLTPEHRDGLFQPSRSWARVVFESVAGLPMSPPFRGGLIQPPWYRSDLAATNRALQSPGKPMLDRGSPRDAPTDGAIEFSTVYSTTLPSTSSSGHTFAWSSLVTPLYDFVATLTQHVPPKTDHMHVNWYSARALTPQAFVLHADATHRRLASTEDVQDR